MKRVCVVGGGAAGMMAAYAAAKQGHDVTLFEKNEKVGKKIYITGKGRCNITNSADISEFFDSVVTNNTFLYSAFYSFTNEQLIDFLNEFGLTTKQERGGRVFPASDKSSDVIKTFQKAIESVGVIVRLDSKVERIIAKDNVVKSAIVNGVELEFDSIILAAGGTTYPSTGSTGDGFKFAEQLGHSVTEISGSLVGLETNDRVENMAGLTLKNVMLNLLYGKKSLYSEQGEMLFTHNGISGPLVLSASAHMRDSQNCIVEIDLKPALDYKTLDKRLVRDFEERSNQNFSNVLQGLLPNKLIDFVIQRCGISADTKAHSITKQQRKALLETLKCLKLSIKGKRPAREAVITRGGVNVKEIDASTMQSKLVKGLFFAGEMIDVDALTGGYNLQIAFSTGYLAGISQH